MVLFTLPILLFCIAKTQATAKAGLSRGLAGQLPGVPSYGGHLMAAVGGTGRAVPLRAALRHHTPGTRGCVVPLRAAIGHCTPDGSYKVRSAPVGKAVHVPCVQARSRACIAHPLPGAQEWLEPALAMAAVLVLLEEAMRVGHGLAFSRISFS